MIQRYGLVTVSYHGGCFHCTEPPRFYLVIAALMTSPPPLLSPQSESVQRPLGMSSSQFQIGSSRAPSMVRPGNQLLLQGLLSIIPSNTFDLARPTNNSDLALARYKFMYLLTYLALLPFSVCFDV